MQIDLESSSASITSFNPITGERLGDFPQATSSEIQACMARARFAQQEWQKVPLDQRARQLSVLRENLLDRTDELISLISRECGKPPTESLTHDLISAVASLRWLIAQGPSILRRRKLRIRTPLYLHRTGEILPTPVGVVAVISPWNFPFFLPFSDIAAAVMAGNAVIFKPSEVTPLVGQKIQELFEASGFPKDLVQTVMGNGEVGAKLVCARPDKIFFTGSSATGKKIMASAAEGLTPLCLELGGKDALIILEDADLELATSLALWGAFANSGQACASSERLYVHESIHDAFVELFKEKTLKLRQGDPLQGDVDLGGITFENQKAIYDSQIRQVNGTNARFVTGGAFSPDRKFLAPTMVVGDEVESLDLFQDETFGPIIGITSFKSTEEVIERVNRSRYGLLASIVTRNLNLATEMAEQLDVGTVLINEVLTSAAVPETPWGGRKNSGFGTRHSEQGLLEFTYPKHINKPRASFLSIKALWWFPYTPFQFKTFRAYLEMYRGSFWDKVRVVPSLLANFIQFALKERRF